MSSPLDESWFQQAVLSSREALLRQYAFNRDDRGSIARNVITDEELDQFESDLVRVYLLAHPDFLG